MELEHPWYMPPLMAPNNTEYTHKFKVENPHDVLILEMVYGEKIVVENYPEIVFADIVSDDGQTAYITTLQEQKKFVDDYFA